MTTNITRFKERHSIAESCDLDPHGVSIDALYEVNKLATDWLSQIDNESGRETFVVLAYLNLVNRIHEQASGMLVCLATEAWPSAEALARVVLESSVNLLCLSRDGGEKPLLGFFDSWLDEHEKKLTQWGKLAQRDGDLENLERISVRCDYVRSTRASLDACIDHLKMGRAGNSKDVWPSTVYDRFCLVGMEADYRSTYHRMSSTSHALAEDTLTWLLLIHVQDSEALLPSAGKEAVAYSVMLTQISLLAAIESMITCCISRGLTDTSVGAIHRATLRRAIKEIAPLAGVPIVD